MHQTPNIKIGAELSGLRCSQVIFNDKAEDPKVQHAVYYCRTSASPPFAVGIQSSITARTARPWPAGYAFVHLSRTPSTHGCSLWWCLISRHPSVARNCIPTYVVKRGIASISEVWVGYC